MTFWVSGDVGKRVPKGVRGKGMGGRQPAHAPLPRAWWAGLTAAEEDAARRLFVAGPEEEELPEEELLEEEEYLLDEEEALLDEDRVEETTQSDEMDAPEGEAMNPSPERRDEGVQRLSDPSVGDESGDDEPRTGAGEGDKPAGGDKPKTDKKDKKGKKGKEGKKGKKRDKPPSGG